MVVFLQIKTSVFFSNKIFDVPSGNFLFRTEVGSSVVAASSVGYEKKKLIDLFEKNCCTFGSPSTILSAVVIRATVVESLSDSFISAFSSGQTLIKKSSCSDGNGTPSTCLATSFQRLVRLYN